MMDAYSALLAAEEAENSGDLDKAEQLLLRAVRVSRREDLWDRVNSQAAYTAFLVRRGRVNTATPLIADLLQDAGDHLDTACKPLSVLLSRADEKEAVSALKKIRPERFIDCWSLLRASEDCAKAGRFRVAATLAKIARDDAISRDDTNDRWRSDGQLGRVYERQGRIEEAVELWWSAFHQGSANRVIADRLSLHLERTKQYASCALVIRQALRRISDPKVIATLQKRLDRVRSRLVSS
jgi:tetratricopeptide (TPR) repeat protein